MSRLEKQNHKLGWFTALFMLLVSTQSKVFGQTMQAPQIGAFLPKVVDVAPSEPMPIDGLWKISTINKLIRIDRGRAYAIDGWTHLFVLVIKPGMVTIQNLQGAGEGIYTGDDLPLAGPLKATLTGDRILDVKVAGKLGEARYQLIPQQLDDQEAFNELIKAVRAAGR